MAAFQAQRPGWQVKRLSSAVEGLSPRGGASLCSTPVGLLIFGGANRAQEAFDDFVLLAPPRAKTEVGAGDAEAATSGLIWTKVESTGDVPQPRSGHATVCYGRYLFLFGGVDFVEEQVFSDLYVLNLDTWHWKYVGETGAEIAGRNSHSLVVLAIRAAEAAGTVALDGAVTTAAAAAAAAAAAVESAAGTCVAGGVVGTAAAAVGASSSSSSSGSGKTGTGGGDDGTGTSSPLQHWLVVHGGASPEKGPLGDTFAALLPQDATLFDNEDAFLHWEEVVPTASSGKSQPDRTPEAREMHATVTCTVEVASGSSSSSSSSSSMFIVGGKTETAVLGDVWELTANPNPSCREPSAAALAAASGKGAAPAGAAKALDATTDVFCWRVREDMFLDMGRCAHGAAVVSTGKAGAAPLLCILGGFTGAGIAETVEYVPVVPKQQALSAIDSCGDGDNDHDAAPAQWKGVKCGAAVGSRFGCAVAAAPKWLLDSKFPENKDDNVDNGALLVYGGVNMDKDFGDLLLLLPPNVPMCSTV